MPAAALYLASPEDAIRKSAQRRRIPATQPFGPRRPHLFDRYGLDTPGCAARCSPWSLDGRKEEAADSRSDALWSPGPRPSAATGSVRGSTTGASYPIVIPVTENVEEILEAMAP